MENLASSLISLTEYVILVFGKLVAPHVTMPLGVYGEVIDLKDVVDIYLARHMFQKTYQHMIQQIPDQATSLKLKQIL